MNSRPFLGVICAKNLREGGISSSPWGPLVTTGDHRIMAGEQNSCLSEIKRGDFSWMVTASTDSHYANRNTETCRKLYENFENLYKTYISIIRTLWLVAGMPILRGSTVLRNQSFLRRRKIGPLFQFYVPKMTIL